MEIGAKEVLVRVRIRHGKLFIYFYIFSDNLLIGYSPILYNFYQFPFPCNVTVSKPKPEPQLQGNPWRQRHNTAPDPLDNGDRLHQSRSLQPPRIL